MTGEEFDVLAEDYSSGRMEYSQIFDLTKVKTYTEDIQEAIDNMWSRLSPWAIKRIRKTYDDLNNNQMLLGWEDKDFETEPVIVKVFPYSRDNPQSTRWLVSAAIAGSGKTVLGMNIAEQYNYRLNYAITIFDAKPEAQSRKTPQDDHILRHKLLRVNESFNSIKPKGWNNMVSVKPMFVDPREFFNGLKIRYDLDEMEVGDIITLFNFNTKSKSDYDINEKLNMMVKGRSITEEEDEEVNPNDEESIEDKILPCRKIMDFLKNAKVDNLLRRRFKNLRDNNVIGNSTNFDIVDLLNQGKTVQYKTGTINPNAMIPETLAYISNEIRHIGKGRQAAIRPKEVTGFKRLHRPALIYFTEYQTIFPRDPYHPSSKDEITNIYNTQRAYGVDIIADSTSLTEIHYVAIKQSDYILSFRLDGVNGEYLRKTKWGAGYYNQMDEIYSLEEDKNNPPFQCAIIKPGLTQDEPLKKFYPLPPMGSLRSS